MVNCPQERALAWPLPLEVTIANERTKLIANALDRASTAFGAGCVVPFLGWVKADDPASAWGAIFAMVLFIVMAAVLHAFARRVLGELLE